MRHLVSRAVVAAAVLLSALCAGSGRADTVTPNTDISGDWHFRFDGDRGAMVLHFPDTPEFGVFPVTGAGYTTLFPAQSFAVQESDGEGGPTPQHLAFNSHGVIQGAIQLQDVTRTTALGSLVVARGTFDTLTDRVTLRGTISLLVGGPAKKVVLVGTRLVTPATALTGRALDGVLSGKKASSVAFDVQVYSADDAPGDGPATSGDGFPFFVLRAGGAARIDGAEFADVRIDGLLVIDRRGTLFGHVTSVPFGGGTLRGTFVTDDLSTGGLPRFVATIKLDSGRTIHLSGVLGAF